VLTFVTAEGASDSPVGPLVRTFEGDKIIWRLERARDFIADVITRVRPQVYSREV